MNNKTENSKPINEKINNIICFVFSIVLVSFIVAILIFGDPTNRLVSCICTLICYLIPLVIFYIFRVKICPSLVSIYIAFITFTAFFSSCLNFGKYIPYLDKIQHFIWGYLSCLIGLYILCRTKEIDTLKAITTILFFIGISLATACIWELIEFAGDTFFNQTAQGYPVDGITPVTDTMLDITVHSLGTIIFTMHFCLDKFTHKNLGITYFINSFKS